MLIKATEHFTLTPVTAEDGAKLYELAKDKKGRKYRLWTGYTRRENDCMAHAFFVNDIDYTVKSFIKNLAGDDVGLLVVRAVGKQACEVYLIADEVCTFEELIPSVLEECKKEYRDIYIIPTPEVVPYLETTKRISGTKIVPTGTKEDPEFRVKF